MASKTWLITGTSRGFGREWTQAALRRGDRGHRRRRGVPTRDDRPFAERQEAHSDQSVNQFGNFEKIAAKRGGKHQ